MKNRVCSLIILLLAMSVLCSIVFSACKGDMMPQPISVKEAEALIKAKLPEKPYAFYVEFQSEQDIEERNYYYFLVYTLSKEPITGNKGPYYQQFTYAWIYVDSQTGELYEMPPTGTELVAWP